MSNVLGIIAEYNPFHNGHKLHLIESKKMIDADYVICVVGGNFTQRGDCSIIDKWSKAEMALLNGADLIIELPVLYSISSAENFAEGAIKILNSLRVVTHVSFGSEVGNINVLNRFADVLYNEPKEYTSLLNHELSKGLSFARARENALMLYIQDIRKYANVLIGPNNILGIEYLKALRKFKSSIVPITIKRENVEYLDDRIFNNVASATGVRKLIKSNDFKSLRNVIPAGCYHILEEQIKKGNIVTDISCFEKEILYNLRKMSIQEIANLPDVSEGLEYSIKQAADSCNTIIQLKNMIKSKRFAETRINRILLYSLLNITKSDMDLSRKINPYIRVLGCNEKGKKLLSKIYTINPKLPVITSVKRFIDTNSVKTLQLMLEKDVFATNIYTLGYEYDSWANLDYTQKLITL